MASHARWSSTLATTRPIPKGSKRCRDLSQNLDTVPHSGRGKDLVHLEGCFAPTRTAMGQPDAYRMIGRRATAAGIDTKVGNHSFRATGITAYLKNSGTLDKAAAMANHASTRTRQLYDRRHEEMSLDEVERKGI